MTRGVPDTSRSVSRENRTITRNIPSIYRKQSTSIRHGPQAGNTHITDAAQAGISPFDVLSAGMLEWWNIYIAGPWDRRKTEKEIEDFATILEGFQRIILGEKFVAEEVIEGVTYEEGSTVPKPSPETFTEDTLNAINTEPRTWQDLIQEILAILPEEFWVGLDYFANAVHTLIDNLSNTIATASGRIERGDGDWGNSAQRFFFGEKTTQAISYGMDDTAGVFPKDTLLGWVLTEPERANLTSDNTVARDFFEFLTSIGLEPLGNFLKETWETLNDWWESLGDRIADAIRLVGEWWNELDQAIRDGIKTAVEWVTEAGDKIKDVLKKLNETFWRGIEELGNAVEWFINEAYEFLSQIGNDVWEWLVSLGQNTINAIKNAISWINGAINNIISIVSTEIRKTTSTIRRTLNGIYRTASQVASAIANGISNWWRGVLGGATSLGAYVLNSITTWWSSLDFSAITSWWDNIPFHRGGTNWVDGIQRVLYGERFESFSPVFRNQVVGAGNVASAIGYENPGSRNTRARTFAEWLTDNIDGLITTASGVVTGVASGIQAFFTDISKVLFGGSIIPAAYASTGEDTPETFVDNRSKHWFAELQHALAPTASDILDEATNTIGQFIDWIANLFTGGSSDIMGANVNLSNLGGEVQINKSLNFSQSINTVGSSNAINIGSDTNNMYLKAKGGRKIFFQNPLTLELGSSSVKFGAKKTRNSLAIGEIGRVNDTLMANVGTKIVNLADIGTGGVTPDPDPDPDPVDKAPTWNVLPTSNSPSIKRGGSFRWTFKATDPDGDTVGYSMIRNSRASIDNDVATFTYDSRNLNSRFIFETDDNTPTGSYQYLIQASSGSPLITIIYTLTITVTAQDVANVAPVITMPANSRAVITVEQGGTSTYQVVATDANADTLRYATTSTGQTGLTAPISTTGLITVTAKSTTDVGTRTITITVSDGKGGSDSERISIKVIKPVPVAPTSITIGNINSQSMTAFESKTITPTISPSDASVTWSLESSHDWVTIDEDTGEVDLDPALKDIKSQHAITIKATLKSDSNVSDTESFNVQVTRPTVGAVRKIRSGRVGSFAQSNLTAILNIVGKNFGNIAILRNTSSNSPSTANVRLCIHTFSNVMLIAPSGRVQDALSGSGATSSITSIQPTIGTGGASFNSRINSFSRSSGAIFIDTEVAGNDNSFVNARLAVYSSRRYNTRHSGSTGVTILSRSGGADDYANATIPAVPVFAIGNSIITGPDGPATLNASYGSADGSIGYESRADLLFVKIAGDWFSFTM